MVKVAAYCRVSTDKTDQVNSLESQIRYFKEYITRNKDWELAKIYIDEGITGTNIKKREGFKKMLEDGFLGCFELIITKEISRFARNTLDSIYYTRKLKSSGIGIIFTGDNINTLDSDSELRLTIMSSIAQEESRKTSIRVKWGQKRSMERGVVFGRNLLGYDVRDGKLYMNEEGASTVRMIFHKFVVEGKGTHIIAKELMELGIPTVLGNREWHGNIVLKILQNEKYCGDLVQRKTYTPDYLIHNKKKNKGEKEFIVIKDHHEPIIDRTLFEHAQNELGKRSKLVVDKKKYSNRYCLSGKIKCGICGSSYVARIKKQRNGDVIHYWRCYERVKNGKSKEINNKEVNNKRKGCNNITVTQKELEDILKFLMPYIQIEKEKLCNEIIKDLQNILNRNQNNSRQKELEDEKRQLRVKRQRLIRLLLENQIQKEDYEEIKNDYDIKMKILLEEMQTLYKAQSLNYNRVINENDKYKETLMSLLDGMKWANSFYKELVEEINIHSETSIEVKLKHLKNSYQINRVTS